MREFFRGWKRKLGCVTLVMACLAMAGWTRSYSVEDRIVVEDAGYRISSVFGRIQWTWKYYHEVPSQMIKWHRQDVRTIPPEYEGPDYRNYDQELSYWVIVIPLTALSCFLLLKKPKTPTQKKTALPIPDEGGGAAS